MKYRKFNNLDWKVSVLGFGVGALFLGERGGAETSRDEPLEMIRYAIDHGINYVDLGYPYDNKQQEHLTRIVGRALRDGYRQKVRISATVPAAFLGSKRDLDWYLDKQIEWLETDRIDFCLLGRINRENWPRLLQLGALDWAERTISDGRFRKLGFSFHDHFAILRNVLDAYHHWAFCQFQYSYMDVTHDPGIAGITYAADKGLAVVVTEPLKGGRLAKGPPERVADVWAKASVKSTPAEWGLRFAWDSPAVSSVVCDMGNIEQTVQNLSFADSAEPNSLTVQEELVISRVRDAYGTHGQINCASCRPCMPCPQGIDVPRIFEIYNDAIIYDDVKTAISIYRNERHKADSCVECRLCEKACARRPQLPIVDWLKKAHELLHR